MNILIPDYALNYDLMPFKNEQEVSLHGLTTKNSPHKEFDYVVYWGNKEFIPNHGRKYGIMETGFFNEAAYIDTIGNYHTSSLNTKFAYDAITKFDLGKRRNAKDIIFKLPKNLQSKYDTEYHEMGKKNFHWNKIILAVQHPTDRAIQCVTSTKKYYEFIEECCKFYGKNLFLKLHPWNRGESYQLISAIAEKYNCQYGITNISVIDGCEFVIAYNSSFAIDCILRDIPYVQYGLGTFFNTFGINYSNHTFPLQVSNPIDAHKLPDFLIHRYCYRKDVSKEKFTKMIKHFSESNDLFPMNDEFSYASNFPD